LKRFYPEISIIGEENLHDDITRELVNKETNLIEKYFVTQDSIELFQENFKNILENDCMNTYLSNEKMFEELIKRNQVKILLDPLDATNSLIRKDFNESTILTGVLVKNKPYLGLITSPFYNYENEEKGRGYPIVTYFNIPQNGVFSFKLLYNNGYKIEKLRSSKKEETRIESEKVSKELKLIVSRTREEKIKNICNFLITFSVTATKIQCYKEFEYSYRKWNGL
jgi:3'-phosphoadenosine 5'-phosphosulfate (PAPS) 3'-phosphatase